MGNRLDTIGSFDNPLKANAGQHIADMVTRRFAVIHQQHRQVGDFQLNLGIHISAVFFRVDKIDSVIDGVGKLGGGKGLRQNCHYPCLAHRF